MPDPMLYFVDPKLYCRLLWKLVRESDCYNGVAVDLRLSERPFPVWMKEKEE